MLAWLELEEGSLLMDMVEASRFASVVDEGSLGKREASDGER